MATKTETKRKSFLVQALSGPNGQISSKRLLGALVLLVCLGCLIFLVATEGGTAVVENIMQTFIIVACALLGIGSVANTATQIFSGKKEMEHQTAEDDRKHQDDENQESGM